MVSPVIKRRGTDLNPRRTQRPATVFESLKSAHFQELRPEFASEFASATLHFTVWDCSGVGRGREEKRESYEPDLAFAKVACSTKAASSLVAASSSGSSGARTGPVVSPTSRHAVLTAAG
jgi:hypothetical protein